MSAVCLFVNTAVFRRLHCRWINNGASTVDDEYPFDYALLLGDFPDGIGVIHHTNDLTVSNHILYIRYLVRFPRNEIELLDNLRVLLIGKNRIPTSTGIGYR